MLDGTTPAVAKPPLNQAVHESTGDVWSSLYLFTSVVRRVSKWDYNPPPPKCFWPQLVYLQLRQKYTD